MKLIIIKPIELIEYAIKANRVQAEKFNIQIEVQYPEGKIGKLFVDSEKIAWVLTNLLSNAIGFDARYHISMFDHYFRVPVSKVQGSGLGLSISRDFMEAHNGTLTVDSELGKGTMFTMRFAL